MANRHLARSVVLQTLFEWDFSNKSLDEALGIIKRNSDEFAPGANDHGFMESLLETVVGKKKDLDAIITKAAPDWPIEKISVVDRNILRMGLCELLFSDAGEVPPKVAINEAIELAKSFGGDTSSKFVNGVLGAVYKEMGEPGKNDISTRKRIKDIPDHEIPIEQLGGALVFSLYEGELYIGLVHDVFGHWTLSKGHLNPGEDVVEGVGRVIEEELSVPITVKDKIGDNEYIAFDPEKGKIKKRVTYYLAEAPFQELVLPEGGGLDNARWFTIAEIADLNFYNDIMPLITRGIGELSKYKN